MAYRSLCIPPVSVRSSSGQPGNFRKIEVKVRQPKKPADGSRSPGVDTDA
jgi:hypothetical protein